MGKKSKKSSNNKNKSTSGSSGGTPPAAADHPPTNDPPSAERLGELLESMQSLTQNSLQSLTGILGDHSTSGSGADANNQPANDPPSAARLGELLESMQSLTGILGDHNASGSAGDILRHRKREEDICIGRIVVLEGLQSQTGKQLNGKYAMVISQEEDDDGRWECKVLHRDRTVGIKMRFMTIPQPEETLHPKYMEMSMYKMKLMGERLTVRETQQRTMGKFRTGRGICYNDEPVFHQAQKLVQLLDYPDEEHEPNQTVMLGMSEFYYQALTHHEHMFSAGCTMYDLEHMAACISLASICQGNQGNQEPVEMNVETSECILFALMEAAPRSLETLLSFIVMTPYIGVESDNSFHRSRENPALTQAQDNDAYIDVMKGPIGLLCFLLMTAPKECNRALFLYMQRCFKKLYPLMIQRLFNILSRESAGMADGMALGKYTRNIIARICNLHEIEGYDFPVPLFCYLCECNDIEYTNIHLLHDAEDNDNITEFEQIIQVIGSIVDPDIAIEFYKQTDLSKNIELGLL